MAVSLETKTALRTELTQLLQKHIAAEEIDPLIEKIWPEIEESLDFAEFTQAVQATLPPAPVIDPLQDMSDKQREAHIQERIANMDADTRRMLERTQGKWAIAAALG